jgi:hypothetical protein
MSGRETSTLQIRKGAIATRSFPVADVKSGSRIIMDL